MPEEDDLVGRTLAGKYRVVRKLGSGGMGAVWEAVQEGLGRPVAIKTVHSHLANDKTLVARFRREAESVARIGHPHIVQVFDFVEGQGDDPPFLVMELLSGESLQACVKRGGALAPDRAARIGVQALAALEAAHRAGVVHRDVKPDNVFLVTGAQVEDFVKVLDFGVAKLLGEGAEQKLTATGLVVGTLAYMAPEQATGGNVDGRTDEHALAACLYFATCGKRPYLKGSTREMLMALATQEAPPLSSQAPTVEAGFASIVEKALRREPSERWESCAAMGDALDAWLVTRSSTVTAPMAAPAPSVSAPTRRDVPEPPTLTAPPVSLAPAELAAATEAQARNATLEVPAAAARPPSSPPRPHTLVSAGVEPPARTTLPSPDTQVTAVGAPVGIVGIAPGSGSAPASAPATASASASAPATATATASASAPATASASAPATASPGPVPSAPTAGPHPLPAAPTEPGYAPLGATAPALAAPIAAAQPRRRSWALVLAASAGAAALLGTLGLVGLFFVARTADSLTSVPVAEGGAPSAPANEPTAAAATEPVAVDPSGVAVAATTTAGAPRGSSRTKPFDANAIASAYAAMKDAGPPAAAPATIAGTTQAAVPTVAPTAPATPSGTAPPVAAPPPTATATATAAPSPATAAPPPGPTGHVPPGKDKGKGKQK